MKPKIEPRFQILNFITGFLFIFSTSSTAQNCDIAFSLTGATDIEIHSTVLTADGNILIVGSFRGTNVDFDPGPNLNLQNSPNYRNAFIASYTKNNQLNWVKTIGGSANLNLNDVAVDASGRIYVCGNSSGTTIDLDPGPASTNHAVPENTTGMVVACYSSVGNYRWGFIIPAEYNWELQSSVEGYHIALDKAGNILISGIFQTTLVDFDPGLGVHSYSTSTTGTMYNSDAFLVKYSQNGNYVWSTAVQSQDTDEGNSLTVDNAGNVYFCGSFSGENTSFSSGVNPVSLTSFGSTDIFISKYDKDGNIKWAKNMGSFEMEQANDIKLDLDTNIYIAGIFKGSADMDPDKDSTFIKSRGNYDCFFAKYNPSGELIYAKSIGSDENDLVYKMEISSSNDIYLTGYYKARANNDFDPDEGVKKLYTNGLSGNNYLFVCSYSDEGKLNWATSGINDAGIYGSALLSLSNESVMVGGRFYGATGSIPTLGDNLFLLGESGKTGIFLATVSPSTGVIEFKKMTTNLIVYPNPVTSSLKLKIEEMNHYIYTYNAQLYNSSGILIYNKTAGLTQIEQDLNEIISTLAIGNYSLKLNSSEGVKVGKFVKK